MIKQNESDMETETVTTRRLNHVLPKMGTRNKGLIIKKLTQRKFYTLTKRPKMTLAVIDKVREKKMKDERH